MPRHHRTTADDAPGNDSFLDVVANMVGILIILVMVVGVQAKDAFVAQASHDPTNDAQAANAADLLHDEFAAEQQQLDATRRRFTTVKSEVRDLMESAQAVGEKEAFEFEIRNQLQQHLLASEQKIQQHREKLDDSQQADFEMRRQLQAAQSELDDLANARIAVENSTAPVVVLKHLPTPMAKTVFGEEEHFRLLGGRLAYVPLNALVKELKQQAELKIYKLKDAPAITETIGPVGGFSMKYTLVRRKAAVKTPHGTAIREIIDLDNFTLVPAAAVLGEPLDVALAENSEFRNHLRRLNPNTTTITVWTYPDSFAEFRRVKDELYKLGFLAAGRPMPEGHPIGGSPNGTRSGAQ